MMNSDLTPPPSVPGPDFASAASETARPAGLPWMLILGLSSLALLWPLTALLGIGEGGPRALTIIGLIAVAWIGVVGFGHVHRPVLTLTLVGVGYGVITMLFAAIVGGGGLSWALPVALAFDAMWGLIAGLIALAIQKIRGRR